MQFLKMLETFKIQDAKYGKLMNVDSSDTIERLSKAQPFIFMSHDGEQVPFEDVNPDLPFNICSFEIAKEGTNDPHFTVYVNPEFPLDIFCIIAEEISPSVINYHCEFSLNDCETVCTFRKDDDSIQGKKLWNTANIIVNNYLLKLKNGKHGFKSERSVFKWKHNGIKKQSRIKKVIYVTSKNTKVESINKHGITWSHAFWVMGHWRTIDGIGKDREGNYCVNGKTWVVPFVKGSEIGEPIIKTRIINEQHSTDII